MPEKIRCLIIDDELPARKVIEKFLSEVPDVRIAGQCKNAFEAMEALQNHQPHLIFLDINMPGLSGLAFLKTLENPPLVIITTAYREYALEGFELDVLDYLHKPFAPERFYKALQKARQRLSASVPAEKTMESAAPGIIFIKEEKRLYKVETAQILYVESVGDYVKFHTAQKVYLAHQTLKGTEEILRGESFLRVHKSYIVNMKRVTAFEGNLLFLGQKSIPIGQLYKQSVQDFIEKRSI
jgi:DNA-binding LytR/AlgR family response regulator